PWEPSPAPQQVVVEQPLPPPKPVVEAVSPAPSPAPSPAVEPPAVAVANPRPVKPRPVAAAKPAALSIITRGCTMKVVIDDKPMGNTPHAPFVLPAGTHVVKLSNPYCEPKEWQQTISLPA